MYGKNEIYSSIIRTETGGQLASHLSDMVD